MMIGAVMPFWNLSSCSMMAREIPCITGPTASKWLGFGASVRRTSLPALVFSTLL